ncbi:WD40 repeat domain-containing protein [Paenibacillus illinoisensis]|uniref:6-phosphogluconolactonase, cycloisomerase 2 family n=1 Tax=Paenibacillus illinoisensis TaxID=59845 RepID=A0A2W0CCH4_9BACL|nr:WD40 repeat domain-containing protein [Paenibacillus illinoisensis]PYY28389.1 6-phosphogluconolactonase, cycloisomerase 2 family [Paenibacillus illinoisensis]
MDKLNQIENIELPKSFYIDHEGTEKEINLSVIKSNDPSYYFENTTNTMKAYFKKDICSYAPIKVQANDMYFEWTPFGVGYRDELGNEQWIGRINSAQAEIASDNIVMYRNLLTDVDDEFIIEGGKLKHNTILNSLPQLPMSLPGKQISFVVDGMIDFSDTVFMYIGDTLQGDSFETTESISLKDKSGQDVFKLPSPIAFEVNGDSQIGCKYLVHREQNIITFKIIVPYNWLSNQARTFPVAIDPTLVTVPTDTLTYAIRDIAISPNEQFVGVIGGTKPRFYELDKNTNRLSNELPEPTGGHLSANTIRCLAFSNDSQYVFYTDYIQSGVRVVKYDIKTGGFSNRITQTMSHSAGGTVQQIVFNQKGDEVLFIYSSSALYCKFDMSTGILSAPSIVSLSNTTVTKAKFTKDDKYLIVFSSDGRIRVLEYTSGIGFGNEVIFNHSIQGTVTDFDISIELGFLSFSTSTAPFYCVAQFDTVVGTINNVLFPSQPASGTPSWIRLSSRCQFITTAIGSQIVFFRFNPKKYLLEGRVPDFLNNGRLTSAMSTVNNYFGYGVTSSGSLQTVYLYKFFYEPSENIFFREPSTLDYYSDNKGQTLMLVDFGTIIAGQTTQVKKILLHNLYNYDVKDLSIYISKQPSLDFKVELSLSEVPFTPETNLMMNRILKSGDELPFYIRVSTNDQVQSGGMFEINLKCDKA